MTIRRRRPEQPAAASVLERRLLGVARADRRRLLRGRGEEDRRAVLRADVEALAVAGRRVVGRPEALEQLVVADDRRVERHLDRLRVAGALAAHLAVGRVLRVAAGVADARGRHTVGAAELGLDAPEAAGGEDRGLGHALNHDSRSDPTPRARRGRRPRRPRPARAPRRSRAAPCASSATRPAATRKAGSASSRSTAARIRAGSCASTARPAPRSAIRRRVVGLVGEQRDDDLRDAGEQRAQRGAGAAVADHRVGLGEHLGLRDPALGAHVAGQRSERGRVGLFADRHEQPDRQVGERVDHRAVEVGEEADRRRDRAEAQIDERRPLRGAHRPQRRRRVVEAQRPRRLGLARQLKRRGRERQVGRGGEPLARRVGLEARPRAQLIDGGCRHAHRERLHRQLKAPTRATGISRASAATAEANSQASHSTTSGRQASIASSTPGRAGGGRARVRTTRPARSRSPAPAPRRGCVPTAARGRARAGRRRR